VLVVEVVDDVVAALVVGVIAAFGVPLAAVGEPAALGVPVALAGADGAPDVPAAPPAGAPDVPEVPATGVPAAAPPSLELKLAGGKTQTKLGVMPTGMVETTLRAAVSMTDTLFDPEFATKAIAPSGDIAIDAGSVPTWIVVTWLLVSRSNTTTAAEVADVAPVVPVDGDGVAFALVAPAAAVVGEAAAAALAPGVPVAFALAPVAPALVPAAPIEPATMKA